MLKLAETTPWWNLPPEGYTCSVQACVPTNDATRSVFRQLQAALTRFKRGLKGERKLFDDLALNGEINPSTYLAAKVVYKLLEYDLNESRKVEAAVVSHQAVAASAAYLAKEFNGWADVYGLPDPTELAEEIPARREPIVVNQVEVEPAPQVQNRRTGTGKLGLALLAGVGLLGLGLFGYIVLPRRA